MENVTVQVATNFGHVTISAEGEEDIFLQDQDADEFIEEARRLYQETQDCDYSEIWAHLAAPYVENRWN